MLNSSTKEFSHFGVLVALGEERDPRAAAQDAGARELELLLAQLAFGRVVDVSALLRRGRALLVPGEVRDRGAEHRQRDPVQVAGEQRRHVQALLALHRVERAEERGFELALAVAVLEVAAFLGLEAAEIARLVALGVLAVDRAVRLAGVDGGLVHRPRVDHVEGVGRLRVGLLRRDDLLLLAAQPARERLGAQYLDHDALGLLLGEAGLEAPAAVADRRTRLAAQLGQERVRARPALDVDLELPGRVHRLEDLAAVPARLLLLLGHPDLADELVAHHLVRGLEAVVQAQEDLREAQLLLFGRLLHQHRDLARGGLDALGGVGHGLLDLGDLLHLGDAARLELLELRVGHAELDQRVHEVAVLLLASGLRELVRDVVHLCPDRLRDLRLRHRRGLRGGILEGEQGEDGQGDRVGLHHGVGGGERRGRTVCPEGLQVRKNQLFFLVVPSHSAVTW
ncbi:MAG: hypothetical protein IPJ19_07620 [Planctomycetes bacterium]|nr:hypothetical protein [Planctomycetota bacterium]